MPEDSTSSSSGDGGSGSAENSSSSKSSSSSSSSSSGSSSQTSSEGGTSSSSQGGTSSGSSSQTSSEGGTSSSSQGGTGSGSGSGSGDGMDAARGDNTNTDADTTPDASNLTLTVTCGHHSRSVSSCPLPGISTLQIVPNSNATTLSTSLTILKVLQISLQGTGNGTDSITATLSDSSGAAIPNPQIAIVQADSAQDSDYQNSSSATQSIPTPGDTSIVWLADAQPTTWNVFGRGNPGDTPVQVTLQAYPAFSAQGSLTVTNAANVVQDITDKINDIIEPFNAAGKAAGFTTEVTTIAPSGTLQLSSGWQEYTDTTAYYGWQIVAGLSPFFGASITYTVNLLALAGTAIGVPAYLTQYAAGINIGLQIGGQLNLTDTVAQTGPGVIQGGLTVSGQLWLQLSASGVIGNKEVLSAQIVGAAKSGFTLAVSVSGQSGTGLIMNPSLTWNGLVVSVSVSTSAYGKEMTNNQLCAWTVFNSVTWQPDSPWILIGSS